MSNRSCDVLLVGFESQENLGLRSLAAFLEREGIRVEIQAMQEATEQELLNRALREKPQVIGFSLIFQRMLDRFADVISYLRENGVPGHFTMGGHFPTFAHDEILSLIPGLDSVIRNEGEETLLELVRRADTPNEWSSILGLSYRVADQILVNPTRPLVENLDSLPFPIRDPQSLTHRGIDIRSITASRGCYYSCSFCSISAFYRAPLGPPRRSRSPNNVVREMKSLHDDFGTRIFIFQDDDLFLQTPRHRDWLDQFLAELRKAGLSNEILWRVSCRIDDLDADYLQRMRDVGLASVYLGIESASDSELRAMNKGYIASAVYEAVELLHSLRIPYEFGFMLFTPDSTFETVTENMQFLRRMTDYGDALIHFCKMSPYAGTAIQQQLKVEGRLTGSLACPDYRLGDTKLDLLQMFFAQTFNFRNFSDAGLVERLRFAKFDANVLRQFGSGSEDADRYEERIKDLIHSCNESAIGTMSFALSFVDQNTEDNLIRQWRILESARQHELSVEEQISHDLDLTMAEFGSLTQETIGGLQIL